MRTLAGLVVALLVVVAGCSAPIQPGGGGDDFVSSGTPNADAEAPPDPETDRLGWENGYWDNESLAIDTSDGVNDTERAAIVARTMARVERVRQLEFERTVPVRVISRETYREEHTGVDRNHTDAFRRFDNAKFEALFLVGEDEDSLATQTRNRGSNVLGFYSPRNESIVIVEGEEAAVPSETTLAHELIHALQDQHYNLSDYPRPTREKYNAVNGLIEGDAHYTDQRYRERCESEWNCFAPETDESESGGSDLHFGVYFLNFFPYSDGPPFVAGFHEQGGWDRVDALYDDPPASTEQVIDPSKYGEDAPTDVALADRNAGGWERVRLSRRDRPDHSVLGQSALSAMFAYTFADSYNRSSVVDREAFVNVRPDGKVNRSDPFDYDLASTRGWDGDRLHVYEKGGETAYVWKLVWDSPAEATEFADAYRALLSHWGGERVGDGVWRIDDGPFADAYRVRVDGDAVVVTNAPTVEDVDDVRSGR